MTETKRLNLLAGNNNCTCVDIDCQGSLYVAISIPNTSLSNVPLCPINTNMSCYSPDVCSELKGMIPFFRICKQSARPDQCTYNISFGNITEQLNGTRLDFFVLTRTLCNPAPPYLTRTYVHSFEMNGKLNNLSKYYSS